MPAGGWVGQAGRQVGRAGASKETRYAKASNKSNSIRLQKFFFFAMFFSGNTWTSKLAKVRMGLAERWIFHVENRVQNHPTAPYASRDQEDGADIEESHEDSAALSRSRCL